MREFWVHAVIELLECLDGNSVRLAVVERVVQVEFLSKEMFLDDGLAIQIYIKHKSLSNSSTNMLLLDPYKRLSRGTTYDS